MSNNFVGFIFSKLHLIGSKSQGPTYYLQQFIFGEAKSLSEGPTIEIVKQVQPWEEDPSLQEYLGKIVKVAGVMVANKLKYEKVKPFKE